MRGHAAHARVDEPQVEATPGGRIERASGMVGAARLDLAGSLHVAAKGLGKKSGLNPRNQCNRDLLA
jgi:hypothetical protein